MAIKKMKDVVEIKADAAAVEKAVKETAKKAEKAEKAVVKAAEKPAEKKAVKAAKKVVKKAEDAVATVAKKATKAVAKEAKAEVVLQFAGNEIKMVDVLDAAKKDFAANNKVALKTITLYVKPEDGAAYYVANGDITGKVNL
ncbi:MAG: DUF6465 family protein [Lachnospiraceae bacterium]|nr:DUF6465 family protein [Lachnospiraceae bacterium]